MIIDHTSIESRKIGTKLLTLFQECIAVEYIEYENSASCNYTLEEGVLKIYFEQSNGAQDWLNNLNFRAKVCCDDDTSSVWYCHGGFLSAWNYVKDFVYKAVNDNLNRLERVTVIGFSHGAGLSVLCHEFIYRSFPGLRERLQTYAFGCPKVYAGCEKGTDISERWRTFFVIRNTDDIVTHLPPSFLGYSHVGNIISIGKRGKYSCYDCPDINAHRPENYVRELSDLSNGVSENDIIIITDTEKV